MYADIIIIILLTDKTNICGYAYLHIDLNSKYYNFDNIISIYNSIMTKFGN